MFGRIKASGIPLSTFWLWTNEGVENHGNGKGKPQSDPMWQELVQEIKIAQQAVKAVGANFSLGTNGWTVGPGDNASFFDLEIADKDSFCMNKNQCPPCSRPDIFTECSWSKA